MISPLEHRSLFTKTLDAALAVEFAPNAYSPESNAARHILQSLKSMAEELRGFTPGKGALVEEKLELMNMGRSGWARDNRNVINDSPVDVALDAVVRAPKDQRDSLYYQISLKAANAGDFNLARHIVTFMVNRVQRRSALDNIERTVVNDAINKGRLDEALAGIRNMKSRSERVSMISQILHSVGQGQKADAAINLLEQARALIATPRGEDQSQVSVLLQIAGVFARYDPHRGFDIFEPFLDQFNDLTVAASALNGFGEEYYQNGELALHNGNGLADVANELVQAIAKLAAADFDRARNAVDRIQRPEVRISAFLAIGRQAIHPPPTWIRTW
jgi:hypothetical protein